MMYLILVEYCRLKCQINNKMVDKFLKDFLNWSKELSLPMNVHELEASWEGLYA